MGVAIRLSVYLAGQKIRAKKSPGIFASKEVMSMDFLIAAITVIVLVAAWGWIYHLLVDWLQDSDHHKD